MKTIYCLLLTSVAIATAEAQVQVDPAISSSAQQAVQKLGTEMMKGNFNYGIKNIYPRWKRRLAKRYGGMAKLDAALQRGNAQKAAIGFTITGYQAKQPTAIFDVWKAKKMDLKTNKPVKDAEGNEIILEHWLAIVPTVIRVKVRDPKKGIMRELEETGYAAVVCEKKSGEWKFLTGMKPTVQDLRSLFPSLPNDTKALGIPASSAREIK